MAEQIPSTLGATTVLAGGYTAGSGLLNVTSTVGAPLFPTLAVFRVVIQDATTNAVLAVLMVTAINSATQFAVAPDPVAIDANAAAGDNVYCVLTADGLAQLLAAAAGAGVQSINADGTAAQVLATGTAGTDFALVDAGATHTFNLPAADATHTGKLTAADWIVFAAKQAALGFTPENVANKSNDTTMAADSATLYPTQHAVRGYVAATPVFAPFGRAIPFQEPDNSAYSWVNQDTAVVTAPVTPGPIMLRSAVNGTDEQMMRVRTYPVVPFTLDAQILLTDWIWVNFQNAGICICDAGATPKVLQFCIAANNGNFMRVYSWATPSSSPATVTSIALPNGGSGTGPPAPPRFWRLVDDLVATITVSFSWDGSIFIQLYSAARTSFLTPTRFGFSINALQSPTATGCILESWKVS